MLKGELDAALLADRGPHVHAAVERGEPGPLAHLVEQRHGLPVLAELVERLARISNTSA